MNKKILGLAFLSAALISVTSCTNLLDIEETDFIAGATALRTVQNNESLIIGAYGAFNGQDMNVRLNGQMGDEVKPGEFYARASTHEWQYNYDDVTIRDEYNAHTVYYRIIDRANRVLAALPDAIEEVPADAALRTRVEGEAHFLRAYAHFELFRFYAGNYDPNGLAMPYMETPSLEPHARDNMGDYFTKLLSDITTAKALLPALGADRMRANKIAATGLHARVALYMRNWPEAITHSTEFINALPLASRAEFENIWTDESVAEVAWKLGRNTGSRMGSWYRPQVVNGAMGSSSWIVSDKLWDSFTEGADDVRFTSYLFDIPFLAADGRPSKMVHKYAGYKGDAGFGATDENVADIKMLRTAEMYLIRAEARAETGSFTGANSAESDINALRAARINGYTPVTFGSAAEAITAVINERYKELAFEGHRFWDLKRRGLPIERAASDAPSTEGRVLPANHFRFTLPIPRPEMLANPLMVQNPGYSN